MNQTMHPILAAEDEASDRLILELVFEKVKSPYPLVIVRDGQEAVEYLSGEGPFADRTVHPLPGLLILDLKMPRMNGFDVLGWLATQPRLKGLPAVVLSSSPDDSDIKKAKQLGAREYFVKPHNFNDLLQMVQQIQTHWSHSAPGA